MDFSFVWTTYDFYPCIDGFLILKIHCVSLWIWFLLFAWFNLCPLVILKTNEFYFLCYYSIVELLRLCLIVFSITEIVRDIWLHNIQNCYKNKMKLFKFVTQNSNGLFTLNIIASLISSIMFVESLSLSPFFDALQWFQKCPIFSQF